MGTIKRNVCLANSRKLNGRCVAGIEVSEDKRIGWVRPVSAREHEEVSEYERQYEDGSDPRVLDLINVPLIEARPKGYQQENWLLDPNHYWVKVGVAKWSKLQRPADPVAPLWINGYSTGNGLNDKIPIAQTADLRSSLRLIRVNHLTLSVYKPGEFFGNPKRRVQGRFRYGDTKYAIWVTDPYYEETCLSKPDGEYKIGESYLSISLGEPYKGDCYKLIAAIIERDGVTLE
jgi:hypothetical protein